MVTSRIGIQERVAAWGQVASDKNIPAVYMLRSILRWTFVCLVGVLLGFFTLGVAALPRNLATFSVLALLGLFSFMILGHIKKALLAVILLELPIQLDIYLNHQPTIEKFNGLSGLNISLTTFALAVLYILWAAEALARASASSRFTPGAVSPLGIYLLMALFSLTVAQERNLALFEIFLLLQAFLLYTYIVHFLKTSQDVYYVVTLLIFGLIIESVTMIGLRLIGHSVTIFDIFARIDRDGRVGGTIGSPNGASSYLSLLLVPALSILLTHTKQTLKWLGMLAFILGTIALVFTQSRGGWIAFAVSLFLFCWLTWRKGWLSISIPFSLAFLALFLALLFPSTLTARVFGDDRGAAIGRLPLLEMAWNMIKDHIWLGVGANNYAARLAEYIPLKFNSAWISVVHNKYLLVWSETGIVGLLAFLYFLTATILRGWKRWQRGDRLLAPLALGFVTSIIGQMFHMAVDLFNGRPQVQLLALVAGILTVLYQLPDESTIDHRS